MIRLLKHEDNEKLMTYLKQETITNYFIIMGLERSEYEEMFLKKWGEFNDRDELIGVMLKRKTGNVQFYSRSTYDSKGFSDILKHEGFNKLIGEENILSGLKKQRSFSKEEKGPFIAKLIGFKNCFNIINLENCIGLTSKDIDRVVRLYEKSFKGFATRKSMMEKLEMGTGRGYYVEDRNEIVSVAQSSYEDKTSALITGVATHPDYRKRGYAGICLTKLLSELVSEGKTLYLQYDNEEAGNIYKKMGFYDIGRMVFYYNRSQP